MLNILVCVKQVPDVNLVKIDPVTGSLIRKGVPAILNPLDANALEAAVQMKEQFGGLVTCITMGPDQAEEACGSAWPPGRTEPCFSATGPLPTRTRWPPAM